MRLGPLLLFSAVAFSVLPGNSASAKQPWNGRSPSFSCSGHLSAAERKICADPDASQSDYFMALAYEQTRPWVSSQEWKAVVAEQREWLVERERCNDTACLIAKTKQRFDRLGKIQRQASDAVQQHLSDNRFRAEVVASGIEALRRKYGGTFDVDYGNGPLSDESFNCIPIAYQRFTCTARLGSTGTCYDGSRSGDSAEFDGVLSGTAQARLLNVAAYEACSGRQLPSVNRQRPR
jgi:uncharacterized protein